MNAQRELIVPRQLLLARTHVAWALAAKPRGCSQVALSTARLILAGDLEKAAVDGLAAWAEELRGYAAQLREMAW